MLHFKSSSLPLISIITYGFCSLFASILQRLIMTKFFFDFPIFISMAQMASTLFILEFCRISKMLNIQAHSLKRAKEMFVPSFLYTFAAYISMNAFEGVSMPMFIPVKRFCPIAVIIFDRFILRRQFLPQSLLCAIFMLCLGSSCANIFKFDLEQWSYLFGMLTLVMLAASLVLIENLLQHNSVLDLLYVNSFNSLVLLLLADFVEDEIRHAVIFLFTSATSTFTVAFIAVILFGVLVQVSSFYCISTATSLLLTVTTDLRSAIQVFVSFMFSIYGYYDIIPGISNVIGLLMAIGGASVVYLSFPFNKYQYLQKSANPFKG